MNGEERGTTPKHLVLPIGLHRLEVRKRGYYIWDNKGSLIQITQPGKQQPIEFTLTPVQVTGEVRFRNSNRPVKGVMVVILDAKDIPSVKTKTNTQGQFVFNDWSQNDLSESDEYKICISDESGQCRQEKKPSLKDLGDFTTNISLGIITVERVITFAITVTNAARNISMPNAVVQLNQQQILDDNRDGVFEHNITNPPNFVILQVSQDGYETTDGKDAYKETITIESDKYKYHRDVQLTPALNTYLVKITNQFKEPVAGVTVILNEEQLGNVTNQDGIAEEQRRLAPDEQISLQVQKDGYELFNGSIRSERLAFHQYRLPIQLDVTRISLLAVDESGIPVEGVQINTDDRPIATTDAKGEATISFYRPPNTKISLGIIYKSIEHQITEATILQALKGGRFEILKPGLAKAVGVTGLKIHLPIPSEVRLSVTVQDQNNSLLSGMTAIVNGKLYGETESTGKIDIHARIAIVGNTPPRFEFAKYGETYEPQKTEFASIGTNAYTALVTLKIPYGKIAITVDVEMAEQKIDLFLNAEVSLDGNTKTLRLPQTIQVFPGTHQLSIKILDIKTRSEQPKIAKNDTIPVNLTLPSSAWRACLQTLRERPNDTDVLQSAERMARALGRKDLAQTFRQRREQLLK